MSGERVTFIDLFAGVGGFAFAVKNAAKMVAGGGGMSLY